MKDWTPEEVRWYLLDTIVRQHKRSPEIYTTTDRDRFDADSNVPDFEPLKQAANELDAERLANVKHYLGSFEIRVTPEGVASWERESRSRD